jgi:hypothetical protein
MIKRNLFYKYTDSHHFVVNGELDEVRGPVDLVSVEVGVESGRVLLLNVSLGPTVHRIPTSVVKSRSSL